MRIEGSMPVILLGHGVRASCPELAPQLLDYGLPVLASWQAKDLVDNTHSMFFGCPGIYGQRAANRILYSADTIYCIGNRLSIWEIGYEGLRPEQKLIFVDVDRIEARRFPEAIHFGGDCKDFIEDFFKNNLRYHGYHGYWVSQCNEWRAAYPLIEDAHKDTAYINSYRFMDALHPYLREDEVIAADVGCFVSSAFQTLRLKPPQRLISSGGLGEMGCGLPYAVGASFARGKGEVLCLMGDGGMMLNLQELQTIATHKLPIKIIVGNNAGYLMLKHTQRTMGMEESGVGPASGLEVPDFRSIAHAFGFAACNVNTWDDFHKVMPQVFAIKEPCLVQYFMDPDQPVVPKVSAIKGEDGKMRSARFDQMSPEVA